METNQHHGASLSAPQAGALTSIESSRAVQEVQAAKQREADAIAANERAEREKIEKQQAAAAIETKRRKDAATAARKAVIALIRKS